MCEIKLSQKDFNRFQALVLNQSGIKLHDGKKELVRARLAKRLRQTGHRDFGMYYRYVINDGSGRELVQMLDAISTNLTSFFRETRHFDYLNTEILPRWTPFHTAASSGGPMVWSAGCSSGEEPYSLAMCFNEYFGSEAQKKVSIFATDISTRVLKSAVAGIYPRSRLENLPQPMLKKYFLKGHGKRDGYVKIKPQIRKMIEFKRLNLMEPFPFKNRFNIIFCRNVMIYFDKDVQESIVNKFYMSLQKGGYLFVGHSESLMNLNHPFKYIRPTIYYKA